MVEGECQLLHGVLAVLHAHHDTMARACKHTRTTNR